MKFVNLKGLAYVNGMLRYPSEGTLHLNNEEAGRLIDNDLATDVTDDFAAADNAAKPAESITDTSTAQAKGKVKA